MSWTILTDPAPLIAKFINRKNLARPHATGQSPAPAGTVQITKRTKLGKSGHIGELAR